MSSGWNGFRTGLGIALACLAGSHCSTSKSDGPAPSDASTSDASASDASTFDASNLLIIGNDEKVTWDIAGKQLFGPPGLDTIKLLDISVPLVPQITASVLVENSVTGPPTNVALVRQHGVALVANARKWIPADAGVWTTAPDTTVTVIDLAGTPSVSGTIQVGKQPSGIAVSPTGDLALVANRVDGTLSVLSIQGRTVSNVGTVTLGPPPVVPEGGAAPTSLVSAVAFTPDGRRALVTRIPGNQLAIVNVDGQNVTYSGVDVQVGKDPYNVVVSVDGRIALTADSGNNGASDGVPDTVSVVDLEAAPPVLLSQIVVGDAPEGLAVSPDGTFAAVGLLNGNVVDQSLPYYHPNGIVVGLAINGKTVTKANQVDVLGHCQGLAFSGDSKVLYAGNFLAQSISILQIANGQIVDNGAVVSAGGHPASMR